MARRPADVRAHSRVVIVLAGQSKIQIVDTKSGRKREKLASNSNVLTPTGMGPTMQVSSSWSYDSLSALPT